MRVLDRVPTDRYAVQWHNSRDEWLEARRSCVGGSDVAALFTDEQGQSLSRYGSEYSLYKEKTGYDIAKVETEPMEWGRYFEPAIAQWYMDKTGRTTEFPGPHTLIRSKTHPHRAVSLDRLILPCEGHEGPGTLSIKNVGIQKRGDWDASALDEDDMLAILNGDGSIWEPPLLYTLQHQYEMGVMGLKWGSFAVCIGGQKGIWCDIDRNDELVEIINEHVDAFWERVKNGDEPAPDGHERTTLALKRVYGVADPNLIMTLSDEAQDWSDEEAAVEAIIKAASLRREELRNLIRNELKDAVVGKLPSGGAWTWKPDVNKQRSLRRKKK